MAATADNDRARPPRGRAGSLDDQWAPRSVRKPDTPCPRRRSGADPRSGCARARRRVNPPYSGMQDQAAVALAGPADRLDDLSIDADVMDCLVRRMPDTRTALPVNRTAARPTTLPRSSAARAGGIARGFDRRQARRCSIVDPPYSRSLTIFPFPTRIAWPALAKISARPTSTRLVQATPILIRQLASRERGCARKRDGNAPRDYFRMAPPSCRPGRRRNKADDPPDPN